MAVLGLSDNLWSQMKKDPIIEFILRMRRLKTRKKGDSGWKDLKEWKIVLESGVKVIFTL
jgi:hypothetical protein